jgi:hypothetical protein
MPLQDLIDAVQVLVMVIDHRAPGDESVPTCDRCRDVAAAGERVLEAADHLKSSFEQVRASGNPPQR